MHRHRRAREGTGSTCPWEGKPGGRHCDTLPCAIPMLTGVGRVTPLEHRSSQVGTLAGAGPLTHPGNHLKIC